MGQTLYFIKKDFLGYPISILPARYENNELISGSFDLPKRLPTKLLHFTSIEDLKKHTYCKCGKECEHNKEFKRILKELKISL